MEGNLLHSLGIALANSFERRWYQQKQIYSWGERMHSNDWQRRRNGSACFCYIVCTRGQNWNLREKRVLGAEEVTRCSEPAQKGWSLVDKISEQHIFAPKFGGHVLTPFFWHMSIWWTDSRWEWADARRKEEEKASWAFKHRSWWSWGRSQHNHVDKLSLGLCLI